MKLLLPSMKWIVIAVGLFGFGAIDWFWAMALCDNFIHMILFGIALAFQFYLVVEYASKFVDTPIELDLRSEEEREIDEYNRRKGLVEAAKENLLMKIATSNHVTTDQVDQAVLKLESMNKVLEVPIGLPQGDYKELV